MNAKRLKVDHDPTNGDALGTDLKFDWNADLSDLRPPMDDDDNEPMNESSLMGTDSKVTPYVTASHDHQRTQEQYEELIKQAPNDSQLWIEYMQFYIDQAEIDRARAVAERALVNIYYR